MPRNPPSAEHRIRSGATAVVPGMDRADRDCPHASRRHGRAAFALIEGTGLAGGGRRGSMRAPCRSPTSARRPPHARPRRFGLRRGAPAAMIAAMRAYLAVSSLLLDRRRVRRAAAGAATPPPAPVVMRAAAHSCRRPAGEPTGATGRSTPGDWTYARDDRGSSRCSGRQAATRRWFACDRASIAGFPSRAARDARR